MVVPDGKKDAISASLLPTNRVWTLRFLHPKKAGLKPKNESSPCLSRTWRTGLTLILSLLSLEFAPDSINDGVGKRDIGHDDTVAMK